MGAVDAFREFETIVVDTGEASIFARWAGRGPPLLLLHGFPETHLMWRKVAPILSRQFTVVCADLRGYGDSGCPPSAPDHAPYAKRAMARDMVALMARLGFQSFSVAGHDRGGRVAYRLALDHPAAIVRLAVLDVLPIADAWARADARLALAFWPWSLLAQPAPLPERLVTAAPEAIIDDALGGGWGSPAQAFDAGTRDAYLRALGRRDGAHAICEGIARPPPSTGSTTRRTKGQGAVSRARCWCCGAGRARLEPGTPTPAGRSASGGPGPTMSRGAPCPAATSSPKSFPTPPRQP